MIQFNEISKSFDGRMVLEGVSGTFKPSDTSLIIGGSGTGKSVLLKCLIGLVKPDKGKVLYNGRDFWNSEEEVRKQIRREMGVLFQGGALLILKR